MGRPLDEQTMMDLNPAALITAQTEVNNVFSNRVKLWAEFSCKPAC